MVEFSDRVEETGLLAKRFSSLTKGELIILMGRRRVGKTELLKKFFKEVPHEQKIYLFVDEGTKQELLQSFSQDIHTEFPEENPFFSNWDDFFKYLHERAMQKGKLVVAIDEFQRMKIDKRAFSRLQKAWDELLKDAPIMLVLLGSVVSAIHKIAISSKSPLYGRATAKIYVDCFDYQAFREALAHANLNEEQKILLYATFGGMPRYLEFAEKTAHQPYLEVVEEHVLKKNGLLREEPATILQMELKDTGRYHSILSAIANGRTTLKQISDETKIESQSLIFYVTKLDKTLKLIEKKTPVCGKMSPQYFLKDNFFKFWYYFVAKNTTALEIGNCQYVKDRVKNEVDAFTGKIFEEIIRELIKKFNNKKLGGMAVSVTELGGWWDRNGNEIDVCGQTKETLLLGEVKWRKQPTDYGEISKFYKKIGLIQCTPSQKNRTTLFYVSKNGFTPQAIKLLEQHAIHSYSLQDVTNAYNSLEKK